MSKSGLLYIEHIHAALMRIEEYSAGVTDLSGDQMRYDAILRNLQTLAESMQKLPQAIKEAYPHIKWKDIAGFRNIVAHNYLEGLDKEIVWSVIKQELPVIKEFIMDVKLKPLAFFQ